MPTETVVAVYRNLADAQMAIEKLEAAGVPRSAIHHHTKDSTTSTDYDRLVESGGTVADPTTGLRRERGGFWSWLMGDEDTEEARSHYQSLDRSLDRGDVVVSVICNEANVDQVVRIIEATNPIKIDEHETGATTATDHSATSTATTTAATTSTGATTTGFANQGTVASGVSQPGRTGETIPVHEEQLRVSKRPVTATATVRTFVTERPFEEQIRLREERVRIERRPVDRDVTAAEEAFTERTINITETSERPVVEKTARVVEEVVVNKEVGERVETVRDTVRKEDVEVTRDSDRTTGGGAVDTTRSADVGTTRGTTTDTTTTTGTTRGTTEGETFSERHPNLAHPVETVEDKATGRPTPAEREGKT